MSENSEQQNKKNSTQANRTNRNNRNNRNKSQNRSQEPKTGDQRNQQASGEHRNKKKTSNRRRRPDNRNNKNQEAKSNNQRTDRPENKNRRPNNRGNKKPYGKRVRNYRKRNLSPEEKFLRSYDQAIQKHDDARKVYFQEFHRVDPNRRRKLELIFFRAVENLRTFEEKLVDWQKDLINSKKWKKYRLDDTYSNNHPDQDILTPPSDSEIQDSMVLESQRNRDTFQNDTEESKGSIEDYKAYKGL